MGYNIDEMEELGIIDYYLALSKYIILFVNRNYPLNRDDMNAIVNNQTTCNIDRRNEILNVMNGSMEDILREVASENKRKIELWEKGIYSRATTIEEQERQIFNYIQRILEDLYNYQNGINKGVGRK